MVDDFIFLRWSAGVSVTLLKFSQITFRNYKVSTDFLRREHSRIN
jgi:hypothetical protein